MRSTIALFAVLLTAGAAAHAGTVTITGYDIDSAAASGAGGWAHYYSGTIAAAADPVSTSASAKDYSGGTGTLADSVIGNSESNSQLFINGNSGIAKPTIYLYLDGVYSIDKIEIFGGPEGNRLPGGIFSADVTINGMTANFFTTPFGPTNPSGTNINDRITITGSTLAGKATSTVAISNVGSGAHFSITEIQITGTSVVPLPSAAAMALVLLGGLGAAHLVRRRRRGRF